MKKQPTYKTPQKSDWRNWTWNRIVEHLPEFDARPRRATQDARTRHATATKRVLYLAGPEDNDRSNALRFGFAEHNLIPIDTEKSYVDAIRRKGNLAINTDIASFLTVATRHLDVIIIDLCCGIEFATLAIMEALSGCRAIDSQTVIALNFLRGRENAYGLILRDMRSNPFLLDNPETLHRGKVAWEIMFRLLFTTHHASRERFNGEFQRVASESILPGKDPTETRSIYIEVMHSYFKKCALTHSRPVTHSYKSPSSKNYYDSVVFRWFDYMTDFGMATEQEAEDMRTTHQQICLNDIKDHRCKSKVAAFEACRTVQIRKGYNAR